LVEFIGKKQKCSYYPEAKSFLEEIGMLKSIELKPDVTYAPGTCIHYNLVLLTEGTAVQLTLPA
jgi:hypothetical protein